MIAALFKTLAQLPSPRFRRVLWRSLLATGASFVALWALLWWVIANTALFQIGWLESIVDALGGFAVILLTWLLFPAVIGLVMGFFVDDIADAVEEKHYPRAGPGRGQPLGEILWTAARFTAILLAVNLLLLPTYFLAPGIGHLVALAANAFLLAWEYYEMVALRHLPAKEADALRKGHRGRLFVAGLPVAVLFGIPVVNLIAPIVATAMLTHVFQRLRAPA